MTNTVKVYALALALVLTVAGYFGWRHHERDVGALLVLSHQADSTHRVDSLAAQDSIAKALRIAQDAERGRRAALVQVAAAKALQAATDSAAQAAGMERDQARRLLQDSLATVGALRGEIGRLLLGGVRDSAANANQHAADQRAILSLGVALRQDSAAIATGIAATNAAVRRAVDAERQRDIARKQVPGVVGQTARLAAVAVVTYLVVRR